MEKIFLDINRYAIPQTECKSERADIIKSFVDSINNERKLNNWRYKSGDKWNILKPVTGKQIALKCSHVDMWDLKAFYAECKQKRSFSEWFFGRLKKK